MGGWSYKVKAVCNDYVYRSCISEGNSGTPNFAHGQAATFGFTSNNVFVSNVENEYKSKRATAAGEAQGKTC